MGISPAELARKEEYEAKCTSCGACCCFYAEKEGMIAADGPAGKDSKLSYYKETEQRFTWPDGDEEVFRESGMVMITKHLKGLPACVALEGTPGEDVKCTIYQNRPKHCRLFMPGSNMCINARKWVGFE
jgi:Fe-S-cluster containining protein